MTVKCEKYPQLHVYDLGVKFKDGAAEVTDAAKIEALEAVAGSYGFTFEGERPAAATEPPKQAKNQD